MLTNRDAHCITAGRAAESAARDVLGVAADDLMTAFLLIDRDQNLAYDHIGDAKQSIYEVCDALDWTHEGFNRLDNECARIMRSMKFENDVLHDIIGLQRDLEIEMNDLRTRR